MSRRNNRARTCHCPVTGPGAAFQVILRPALLRAAAEAGEPAGARNSEHAAGSPADPAPFNITAGSLLFFQTDKPKRKGPDEIPLQAGVGAFVTGLSGLMKPAQTPECNIIFSIVHDENIHVKPCASVLSSVMVSSCLNPVSFYRLRSAASNLLALS